MLNGRIARTPITTNFNDKTKTKAAFGEITFTPDIPFELTLSARYEQEHHQRKGKSAMFFINRDKNTMSSCQKQTLHGKLTMINA